MLCNQCGKKLPPSAQNLACPMCKFLMCKKCLNYTLPAAQDANTKSKVCLQCYERVTKNLPDIDMREFEPPKNFLKRIEALNKKQAEKPLPSSMKPVANDTEKFSQRLQSLQASDRKNLPSNAELQARVDALNDFVVNRSTCLKSTTADDAKTAEDDVNAAMAQALDEARLSTRHGEPDATASSANDSPVYCVMCDNLASVVCPACMDEEFCDYCFKKGHKSKSMKRHQAVTIKKSSTN